MDIQQIANLYLILILAAAVISFIIGLIVTKRTHKASAGFLSMLIISAIALITIGTWYSKAASSTYTGTMPVIFNLGGTILLYPFYLLLFFFVFKRSAKRINKTT